MDFIVPLPPSNGYTAILVVVDRIIKMSHLIPTTDNIDATGTISLLMSRVFSLHGLPDDIVSDRGATFTAQFTRKFMLALKIKRNLSTAFHPQTDGQMERTNTTLEQYLRCFINYQQDDWFTLLPIAEFSYNNTVHTSTNQTPFFALTGVYPRFHINVPHIAASTSKAQDHLEQLKTIQEDLRFYIVSAQESQERYYNQHHQPQSDFQPGDKVCVVNLDGRTDKAIFQTRPGREQRQGLKRGQKVMTSVGGRQV
jgi:hypothetical protein